MPLEVSASRSWASFWKSEMCFITIYIWIGKSDGTWATTDFQRFSEQITIESFVQTGASFFAELKLTNLLSLLQTTSPVDCGSLVQAAEVEERLCEIDSNGESIHSSRLAMDVDFNRENSDWVDENIDSNYIKVNIIPSLMLRFDYIWALILFSTVIEFHAINWISPEKFDIALRRRVQ